MRRLILFCVCLTLLAGCARLNSAAQDDAYAGVSGRIAEWGAIVDLASGEQIDARRLLERLADAPTLLVGETHDNLAHHLIERWLYERLEQMRPHGAVVLEMLAADRQKPVRQVQEWLQAGNRLRLSRLPEVMRWDRRWNWEQYGALVGELMRGSAPVLAGNLSEARRESLMAQPPADPLALFADLELARQQRLEIRRMHCGELDPAREAAMLAIQAERDRHMARVLEGAPAPRLLFAGSRHVLKRIGVPRYLREPGARVLLIGEEGQALEAADADFVWLLPARDESGAPLGNAASRCEAPNAHSIHTTQGATT